MSDSPLRIVPDKTETETETCVMCGRAVQRCIDTVIGGVCGACFDAASPESAPYYADWQRAGDCWYAARDRQVRKAQQPTKRKVAPL